MERNSLARKVLFFLLDVLLIIGAIASVLTIDHGRWARAYLDFMTSSRSTMPENAIVPVTGTAGKAAPKNGTACLPEISYVSPDWYDTYLLLNAYNRTVQKNTDKGAAPPLCGQK